MPTELIEFLKQNIQSIGQLEVLLLFQSDISKSWTVPTLSKHLCSNEKSVEKWIQDFVRLGFIAVLKEPGVVYRYSPKTKNIENMITLLAEQYKIRPLKVIDVITNKTTNQMLSFRDAFKMTKDGKNEDS